MLCDRPIYVKTGTGDTVPVPCGSCAPCKHRRVNSWVFRLLQEDKVSYYSHFVTLTYDTRFVPISPNGFHTLCKEDFQLYMKRLRKLCPGYTLKYYAVGEYGSQNKRPHFHAIIFNVDDPNKFFDAWHIDGVPRGTIHVGTVSSDSIAYCMKYIDKNTFKRKFYRDDRVPEFSLMSKGLGASYLSNNQVVRYHKSDLGNTFVTKPDGWKVAMPRYYKEKLYTADEKLQIMDNASQAAYEKELADRKTTDNYTDWLVSCKNNREAKLNKNAHKNRNL